MSYITDVRAMCVDFCVYAGRIARGAVSGGGDAVHYVHSRCVGWIRDEATRRRGGTRDRGAGTALGGVSRVGKIGVRRTRTSVITRVARGVYAGVERARSARRGGWNSPSRLGVREA